MSGFVVLSELTGGARPYSFSALSSSVFGVILPIERLPRFMLAQVALFMNGSNHFFGFMFLNLNFALNSKRDIY